MILYLQHVAIEGPGIFSEYCAAAGLKNSVVQLYKEEMFPENFSTLEAVVILGGPMNVYEEDRYPFLRQENRFIEKLIQYRIPLLGICLGAQLIAKALGAKVKKARYEEIGWESVSLTSQGAHDPLFHKIPEQFFVFQWHEDTFDLPQDALLLAESEKCQNQAFCYGENVYGLQFHIEIIPYMVRSWLAQYKPDAKNTVKSAALISQTNVHHTHYRVAGKQIITNFIEEYVNIGVSKNF